MRYPWQVLLDLKYFSNHQLWSNSSSKLTWMRDWLKDCTVFNTCWSWLWPWIWGCLSMYHTAPQNVEDTVLDFYLGKSHWNCQLFMGFENGKPVSSRRVKNDFKQVLLSWQNATKILKRVRLENPSSFFVITYTLTCSNSQPLWCWGLQHPPISMSKILQPLPSDADFTVSMEILAFQRQRLAYNAFIYMQTLYQMYTAFTECLLLKTIEGC